MKKMNGIAFVQIISALLIVNYHTSRLEIPYLCRITKFGFIFNTIFVFLSGFLFPLYIWLQPRPDFGVLAVFAVLLVAICLINIILMIYPSVEKHCASLFLLSSLTYEIYLIHYSVIDAINHSFHGEYFAYPLVFFATISLALLISVISKRYEKLTMRITGRLLHCAS